MMRRFLAGVALTVAATFGNTALPPVARAVDNAFNVRRAACWETYWYTPGGIRHFGIWHPKWDAAEGYINGVCEWQSIVDNTSRSQCKKYMIETWGVKTIALADEFCGQNSTGADDNNFGGCFPRPAAVANKNYCINL